jgi:hypothetical protein
MTKNNVWCIENKEWPGWYMSICFQQRDLAWNYLISSRPFELNDAPNRSAKIKRMKRRGWRVVKAHIKGGWE